MFQALTPLLKTCDLTLHLHMGQDGTVRVSGLPKRADANSPAALYQPFTLTGTPQALDQQFPALVSAYHETRAELSEQMARVTSQMKANAAAEAKKKATQGKTAGKNATQATSQAGTASKSKTASKSQAQPKSQAPSSSRAPSKSTTAPETNSGPKTAASATTGAAAKTGAKTASKSAGKTKPAASGAGAAGGAATTAPAFSGSLAPAKQGGTPGTDPGLAGAFQTGALAGHDAATLRQLGRDILPADQHAKLTRCNAPTLRQKLGRFLAEAADQQGRLPKQLQSKLDALADAPTSAAR